MRRLTASRTRNQQSAKPPRKRFQTLDGGTPLLSREFGCIIACPMLSPPPRYPVVLSILAALLTLGMKSAAYSLTGSVGLLSDAVESLVNLLAAFTAYLSLWFAAQPVDSSHTYGHEKIEYFSSGLEGMLILIAAVGIIWYAVQRLIVPQPLPELGLGTAISLVASLINLGVAQVLLRVGRATHSIVL